MKNQFIIERADGNDTFTTELRTTLGSSDIAEQERTKEKYIKKYGQPNRIVEDGNNLKIYDSNEDVDDSYIDKAFSVLEKQRADIEAFLYSEEVTVVPVTYTEYMQRESVALHQVKDEGCTFVGDRAESLILRAKVTIHDFDKYDITVRDLYKVYSQECFEVASAYDNGDHAYFELVRDGSDYADTMHAIADLASAALDEVLNATPEMLRDHTTVAFDLTTNF